MSDNVLLAIKQSQTLIDRTVIRLSTGLRVNRVLDNPQNYFAAEQLRFRSNDFSRRLDGMDTSIQTIRTALQGSEAIEELLNQAEAVALNELQERKKGVSTGVIENNYVPLDQQILDDSPVAYWRLNDDSGPIINEGGLGAAVNGTPRAGPNFGAEPLYDGGSQSIEFNGVNQGIEIPN